MIFIIFIFLGCLFDVILRCGCQKSVKKLTLDTHVIRMAERSIQQLILVAFLNNNKYNHKEKDYEEKREINK